MCAISSGSLSAGIMSQNSEKVAKPFGFITKDIVILSAKR